MKTVHHYQKSTEYAPPKIFSLSKKYRRVVTWEITMPRLWRLADDWREKDWKHPSLLELNRIGRLCGHIFNNVQLI
jgi:hypothetical protein